MRSQNIQLLSKLVEQRQPYAVHVAQSVPSLFPQKKKFYFELLAVFFLRPGLTAKDQKC